MAKEARSDQCCQTKLEHHTSLSDHFRKNNQEARENNSSSEMRMEATERIASKDLICHENTETRLKKNAEEREIEQQKQADAALPRFSFSVTQARRQLINSLTR